jgi:hypothetical protein
MQLQQRHHKDMMKAFKRDALARSLLYSEVATPKMVGLVAKPAHRDRSSGASMAAEVEEENRPSPSELNARALEEASENSQ